jgi:hypothetical protein
MRFLLALCLLLGWGFSAALAQNTANTGPVPSAVSATIEQVAPNVGVQRVLGAISAGPFAFEPPFPNALSPSSLGGNVAEIVQVGNGNTTLLRQYGGQNAASIRLDGDNNVVDATQLNGNNALSLTLEGSNNEIPVFQTNRFGRGNDLTLTLLGVDNVRLPFPITQIGALGRPIEITVRRAGN